MRSKLEIKATGTGLSTSCAAGDVCRSGAGSYLRGAVRLEAGDPATAAIFYKHASKLQPENENYLAMFLHALDLSDADAASKQAEEVLQEPDKSPPVVIARAAEIEFKSLRSVSETRSQGKRVNRLVAILRRRW